MNDASPHHERARPWLEGALSGTEPVGFAWIVLVAFVRLSTRPQVFRDTLEPSDAFRIVEGWLARSCALVVHPTDRHLGILSGLIEPLGTAGNLVADAHLAALAIEHGAEVCSADNDFARFRGLRWTNPLI
jgi:toxin-antitoxin system PIN domain toxin